MKIISHKQPEINIIGRVPVPFSKIKIRKLILKILETSAINASSLGILFVSSNKMRALNQAYRKIDKPTDVLSFLYESHKNNGLEGDIVVCPAYVKQDIKATDTEFEEQIKRLFVHAILHLAGMDHKTETQAQKMFGKQEKILKKI